MPRLNRLVPGLLTALLALMTVVIMPQAWGGAAVRSGAVFAFQSPERWFALIGAGLCLALQPPRVVMAASLSVLCGAAVGLIAPHSGLWAWITSPGVFPAHHFLGPAACLLVGVALLAPGGWRSGLLLPTVFVMTGALSLTAALNDPTLSAGPFVMGTVLSAVGLLGAASALRRAISGRWTAVGERIAGSWLLTIGLLLAVLRLAPPPPPAVELAPPATAPVWSAPDVPGYTPPTRRGADPFTGGPGRGGVPMGTN